MEIAIKEIRIPERIRQDLGDIDSLTDSLRTCGQLNPITVTHKLELVAGRRRLEAAVRLGWTTLEARFIDGDTELQRVQMEIQENLCRKDFTPEELMRGFKRLERLQRPSRIRRIGRWFKSRLAALFSWFRHKPKRPSPNLPTAQA